MWVYEKKLQYPINIKQTNPKLAKIIISQYGGLYCKKIYNYRFQSSFMYREIFEVPAKSAVSTDRC